MPDLTTSFRDPYMETCLSRKPKKNLRPVKFKVAVEQEHCWIAYCEYGKVNITSSENMLRITTCKKGGKNVKHITCKFDKNNNFRVYLKTHKGINDLAYSYSYEYTSYIRKFLNSITHIRRNGTALDHVVKEYEERFFKVFNNSLKPINNASNYDILSDKIWKLIYPLNAEGKNTLFTSPSKIVKGRTPPFIQRAVRSHDPKELTRKIFGRAPKSLTKAVIAHLPLDEEAINTLFLAKVFYGIWPLDKVVEFLNYKPRAARKNFIYESSEFNFGLRRRLKMVTHVNQWRKFFRKFTYHKVMNWYKTYTEDFGHYTMDTLHPLKKLEESGYKVIMSKKMDIKAIHDNISRHYGRLKRPEIALPVFDILEELKGQKFDDYDIVFPRTNYDLIDWGQYMDICVGSYDYRVKSGNSIIFTLQQNGSPKYCIEFGYYKSENGFRLRQCNGNRNKRAPEEIIEGIKKKVESVFENRTIEKPGLIFPDDHVVKDITDCIDLEALDNIQTTPEPQEEVVVQDHNW